MKRKRDRSAGPRPAGPRERDGEVRTSQGIQTPVAPVGAENAARDSGSNPSEVSERHLRLWNRVAKVFLTPPDDDVYARVLDIVRAAADSPHGMFSYLDEDGAAVVTSLTRGEGNDCRAVNETSRVPRETWGDNLWTRVVLRQQSLYTNSPPDLPAGHLSIRRALGVPIIYRGAAIGHFVVANKSTDYGAEDVALVEGIAAYMAPILHARLEHDRLDAKQCRAERELEAMSRLPAENPQPVLRIGADGVIQYANAASTPLLAVWDRQVGETVPDNWRESVTGALAVHESREIEIEAGGRDFACLLAPVCPGDYVNVYGHDVTERWLAEKRLLRNRALLSQAERIAGVGAWEWDRARDEFTFSDECVRLLGAKRRLTRAEIATVAHPEDLPAVRQAFADALAGVRPYDLEFRIVRPDTGERRFVHVQGEVVRDPPSGAPLRMYGAVQDTTELKLAQRTLAASEHKYRQIVEMSNEGIWMIDAESRTTFVNQRLADILGYSPAEMIGRPVAEFIFPEELSEHRRRLRDGRAGDTERPERRFRRRDGRAAHLLVSATPLAKEGEPFAGSFGMFIDITERKEAEERLRESEERFRTTFEQAAVGVTHVTSDGRFLRVNQRFADIVGYTPEELRQRTIQQLTYPEDLPAELAEARRLLAGEIDTFSMEKRYVGKNGALVWGSMTLSLARDALGRCAYVIGIVQDITAHKEAEAARREAEQRFTQVFENVDAVAVILSSDECVTFCNPYLLGLTGWSSAEVLGRNWFETFLPATERDRVRGAFQASIHGGEFPYHFENEILTRDGQQRLISWSNTALRDAAGRVIGLASLGYDITDHRRAEEAARLERARLQSILETMEDAVCIVDMAHRFTYVNPSFVRQFGDGWGRTCYAVFHDRAAPCPECKMPAVFAGRGQQWELHDEKTGRFYEVFDSPLQDQDGKPANLEILHDVTARKQAEQGLTQRTRELQTLADNAPDIIVRLNRQLQYAFVNRRWAELTGISPDKALGKTARELGLPDSVCHNAEEVCSQVFADRQMRQVEFDFPTAEGVRHFHVRMVPEFGSDDPGGPQTILVISRDITEQSRLQQELIQAQKMEVVGRLAAGIAHDINNVLLAVSGYAALARAELPLGHRALESLGNVEDTALQAAGIARSLLTFTRRIETDRTPVDLRAALLDAQRLLKRLLPASIDLVCEAPSAQPSWIAGDAAQIQQVILNLAINARDAMPNGGRLWTGLETVKAKSGRSMGKRLPMARLTISDSGTGIAPDVLPRVFEPFFTTKPRGSGSGLGLSIVRSIVENHGGHIELSSTPSTGTAVVIHLPCIKPPRPPDRTESRPAQARGQGEWILIADDNAQVLEVLSASLRQRGYEPQQAANAPSALAHFAQDADRIHLLILDFDLPGGNGLDVLRKVRRAKPTVPAILISGEIERDLDDARDERTRIIRKPFRLDDLMELVIQLLAQSEKMEAAP